MFSNKTSRRKFIKTMAYGSAASQLWLSRGAFGSEIDGKTALDSGSVSETATEVPANGAELFSPEMLQYHIEYGDHSRELIKGALDLHVHSSPDCFVRMFSHVELAIHARQYGLAGVLLKVHCQGTADRLAFVHKLVSGIEVFGSITLNNSVGGLNPVAVESAIGYGAKAVWMPTMDAQNHVDHYGQIGTFGADIPLAWERRATSRPITLLNEDGKLKKEVHEILELIGSANIILNIGGHVSYEETLTVLKAARSLGLEKIIVEHPLHVVTKMPLSRQREVIANGAIINYVAGDLYWPGAPASHPIFANNIRDLGAENIVISSDGGAPGLPPYEMMLASIQLLIDNDFSDSDIQLMIRDRPWDLVN